LLTSIRVVALAVWVLVGCSAPHNAASVTITPATVVLPVGTSFQLQAVALEADGDPILDSRITWSSSNPSAISVSDAGLITAVSHGSAVITASVDGVSANVDAAVAPEFSQISSNGMACGLSVSGAPSCWGYEPPELVPGGLTFTQLTAGGSPNITGAGRHACGITSSGAAYCWGHNALGQLGIGLNPGCGPSRYCSTPMPVAGGLTFVSLSAGDAHTCGIVESGEAYCWGYNNWAQLGAAGDDSCGQPCGPVPLPVRGGLTFAQITAGSRHTCGVTTDGAAYCWGINELGQLGSGEVGGRADVPTPVVGGLTFSTVEAGWEHTCGVTVGGGGWCWGSGDYGALGNGTSNTREGIPVQISGSLTLSSISTGGRVSCAVTTTGAGYCWGQGSQGTLGNATFQDSNVPVPVFGGLTFRSISVSNTPITACGLTDSNVGYCWGHTSGAGSNAPGLAIDRPRLIGG
jgi:hypothetical protein